MYRVSISDNELRYTCKKCNEMTDTEINDTAKLFSENYGRWSKEYPLMEKRGKRIKFAPSKIRQDFVLKPDRYVAMVYHDDALVGHVFYMRRKFDRRETITWILQLVVKEEYRGCRIGTKLMHSIWQLSDSYAWGLYTSNPYTIKALEDATMRKVDVRKITENLEKLKKVAYDLFPNSGWIDSYRNGIVNTEFYTNHMRINEDIARYEEGRPFPFDKDLPEGCEWLAFTFRGQEMTLIDDDQMKTYFEFSDSALINAYSNMKMKKQRWASHTLNDVRQIEKYIAKGSKILDIGCGQGRHSQALAGDGYSVVGIDFSPKHIAEAKKTKLDNLSFEIADAREYDAKRRFDAAICMYDVIGSFPYEVDNLRILKTANKHLKMGSKLILSVMNRELTFMNCSKAKNVANSEQEAMKKVLRSEASNTMQTTGDIFDGRYVVMDKNSGICYRKEQFFLPDALPQEFLIRDKRYSMRSISDLLLKAGFMVDRSYYFQSGKADIPLDATDRRAKEVFVVAHKIPCILAVFKLIIENCARTFDKAEN